jgi:biopolymer transport protein ExbD
MGAKMSSGGGGKRGSHDINAEPNVIPFIDVMLVLLIIFMVASPIATVDIQVAMPTVQDIIPSKRVPKPTWISLKQENGAQHVYVMDEEVTFDSLGERLHEAVLTNTPDAQSLTGDDQERMLLSQRVYLRAQGDMEYRHVVRVMNALQGRGFVKVALVAEDRRRIN